MVILSSNTFWLRSFPQLQVGGPVVLFLSVLVVNLFVWFKVSAKQFFHYVAVLKNAVAFRRVSFWFRDGDVAFVSDKSAAFPVRGITAAPSFRRHSIVMPRQKAMGVSFKNPPVENVTRSNRFDLLAAATFTNAGWGFFRRRGVSEVELVDSDPVTGTESSIFLGVWGKGFTASAFAIG